MSDTKALIERLRSLEPRRWPKDRPHRVRDLMRESAAALEALEAERDTMKDEHDHALRVASQRGDDNTTLRKRVAELEKDLKGWHQDAAGDDI